MKSPTENPPALCITGMGRSGTSLVSSMVQSGGLDIGRRLMGPCTGNTKGHFEDLDFYEFHKAILESQGIHNSGHTLQPEILVREQHLLRARELVRTRRQGGHAWGWKDPRSTLFLDFWQQLVPEANFLFLYRPPWDVVDSLFRRGDKSFRSNPCFAVQVWVHYNRLLLAFHERFPARCLCVHSYLAAQSPALLVEALAQQFGLQLRPAEELYEEALLRRSDSSRWASLVRHHFPEAVAVYEELNERAKQGPQGASLAGSPAQFVPVEDWACHDWLDLRVLEENHREGASRLAQAENDLRESQSDLLAARDRGEQLHHQLRQTEADLSQSLSQARAELAQVQAHLAHVQAILSQTQADLARTRDDLAHAEARSYQSRDLLARMETSKFWKLRKAWFRVKGAVRRAG
jgi:hypothetical protein